MRYRNLKNNELITLSYNPKSNNVLPLGRNTVNQADKKVKYEYVFYVMYRVNPALKDTHYYNIILHTPEPKIDDRDAIVYDNA